MWRELISDLTRDNEPIYDLNPGPEFFPGATLAELEDVERQLGMRLPESLRDLLGESNGLIATFGVHLIWTTDEIVRYNRAMRTDPGYVEHYQSFDSLLFFAEAGVDSIRFACNIAGNGSTHEDVYAWYPIGDERDWKASSLREYLEGWLTGTLSV